jgi:hypothetical protein
MIHFHVRLVGEPLEASNNLVSFEVIIGNVCESDRISLASLIPDITYTVKSYEPDFFTDYPLIVQDEPLCPVVCLLTTAQGFSIPQDIGVSYMSPVVEL